MKIIRAAVVVFINDSGQVLMNHRTGEVNRFGEEWAFLGGGIGDDQSPMQAAIVKIEEEVGYQLSEERDKFVSFKQYQTIFGQDIQGEIHVFLAKFPGFELFTNTDKVDIATDLKLFSIEEGLQLNTFKVAYQILSDIHSFLVQR